MGLINNIYSQLQDEESRNIFKIKQMFMQNKDKVAFAKAMLKLYPDMCFKEIDQLMTSCYVKKICIFGESENDDYMYQVLLEAGYDICRCKSVYDIKHDDGQGYIVFQENLIDSLKEFRVSSDKILYTKRPFTGRIGWQYFDVFSPNENEHFVDIGGYSGETSSDFVKWCEGKYKAIDIFEPNPMMLEKCRKRIKQEQMKNTTFHPIAICDKKTSAPFFINENFFYTARLDVDGKYTVKTDTLDNILCGEKVTFIKIDVEGAESKVIEGAKDIIRINKPRMAISAYHKIDDFFVLAEELLEICQSYRFKLRHYHTDITETILYAY